MDYIYIVIYCLIIYLVGIWLKKIIYLDFDNEEEYMKYNTMEPDE